MAEYDTYDYKAFWHGRGYEHGSEVIALTNFLKKIPKCLRVLDIGCGFGRLTPVYKDKATGKVVLSDPSAKNLSQAKKFLGSEGIEYVQASVSDIEKKMGRARFDLVLLVRVMHHLKDTTEAISAASHLLNKKGYLVLEFANKLHYKAVVSNFLHGNFTFPLEIFPINKAKKGKCLPTMNFHPDSVGELLSKSGFRIIEKRSVSNIRVPFVKMFLPERLLLAIEAKVQERLAKINFGPSIFILAKKVK